MQEKRRICRKRGEYAGKEENMQEKRRMCRKIGEYAGIAEDYAEVVEKQAVGGWESMKM